MASISHIVLEQVELKGKVGIPALKKTTGFTESQLYSALQYLDKQGRIIMVKDGWNSSGKTKKVQPKPQKKVIIHQPIQQKQFSDEFTNLLISHFSGTVSSMMEKKLIPMFEAKMSELSEKLAEKFSAELENRVSVIISNVVQKSSMSLDNVQPEQEQLSEPPVIQDAAPAKNRLRKVCVLGLKPNQEGSIANDFCRSFDIKFWNEHTGSSYDQLSQYAKTCEAFFIHTKHIGHNAQQILAGNNIVYCNGGVTHMKQKLMEYYKEVTA